MARQLRKKVVLITHTGGLTGKINSFILYLQILRIFKPTVSEIILADKVEETKTEWIIDAYHYAHVDPDAKREQTNITLSKKDYYVACVNYGDEDDFHDKFKLFYETYKSWLAKGILFENFYVNSTLNGIYWYYQYVFDRWKVFFKLLEVFPEMIREEMITICIHSYVSDPLVYNERVSKYTKKTDNPKANIKRLIKESRLGQADWTEKAFNLLADGIWLRKEEELLRHLCIGLWEDMGYKDSFAINTNNGSQVIDVFILPFPLAIDRDTKWTEDVINTFYGIIRLYVPVFAIGIDPEENETNNLRVILGVEDQLLASLSNKTKERLAYDVAHSLRDQGFGRIE